MTSRSVLLTAVAAIALVPGRSARAQGPVNVVITLRGDVGQYAGMCGSRTGEDKLSGGLQVKWCFAHLDGSARMNVTLEIYEDNRGAWLKSQPIAAPALQLTKKISGCPEASEWLDKYPKDGIMSGLSFEDLPSGYLRAGKYGTPELELWVY